jgi:hypothetical protein
MYWNLQLRERIPIHHPTVMLSLMRYYQKPSRTQQDQFWVWATPFIRTRQAQIDAQLGLATTLAASAFLLTDAWHRADIEETSPLLPRFQSESELHYNWQSVSQSVSMSWCRAQSGTFDQRSYFFFFFFFFFESYCLVIWGRPLWREVRSVICQSLSIQSTVVSIYINFYILC